MPNTVQTMAYSEQKMAILDAEWPTVIEEVLDIEKDLQRLVDRRLRRILELKLTKSHRALIYLNLRRICAEKWDKLDHGAFFDRKLICFDSLESHIPKPLIYAIFEYFDPRDDNDCLPRIHYD